MATHMPLLVRAFEVSEGNVLEMGTGYFSTLILRWLCEMSGRHLFSYESNRRWYERAIREPKDYHTVQFTPNWDEADIEREWGLAFVDHGPNARRVYDIRRLANYAEYIVIHDTQPKDDKPTSEKGYHFSEIWALFKYRYDYTRYLPWTSCVSNFKNLSNL